MKKLFYIILLTFMVVQSVSASEISPPTAPNRVEQYIPKESTSFWQDFLYIVDKAIEQLNPSLVSTATTCICIITIVILLSFLEGTSGIATKTITVSGTIAVSTTLLSASNALINLGLDTVNEMAEYGKLLMPVMTAALAAEGGTVTSAALYSGTILFNSVLSSGAAKLLTPMLYAFMAICIAKSVIREQVLKNLYDFLKWLITWILKIAIYLFTGYLGITGVVSGTTDAAAVKATKLALSGTVPVIGNIISDASEAILVSTGVIKNATGMYGMLAILAICIGPFLRIGIQYLALKITAGLCGLFGCKNVVKLVENFSSVMGFLLATTGAVCLLLLISTVCFMKGVS